MTRSAALSLATDLEERADGIDARPATAEELGRALAYREAAAEIRDRLGPDHTDTETHRSPTTTEDTHSTETHEPQHSTETPDDAPTHGHQD